MTLNIAQDFFALFGLHGQYALDTIELEQAYRNIQSAVHPDRFANASDVERRVSMQRATQVNEAYQTLKDPIRRAAYLLGRHGVDPEFETNTAMAPEFLMQQMEWREAIEEAASSGDVSELDRLSSRLGAELKTLYAEMARQIDERGEYAAAAVTLRKLKFLEKVAQEIGDALEALEG